MEKLIKGLLTWQRIDFPKTHDLDELIDLVEHGLPSLAAELRAAVALSPYAVEMRYPGDMLDPTRTDAQKALALAEAARDAITRAVPFLAEEG